ncbi:MAG: glycosyltransferase family 9 protein [Chloroflexota bacterium]
MQLNPVDPGSLFRGSFAPRSLDETVLACEAALARNLGDAASHASIGRALHLQRKFAEAEFHLRRALELEPMNPWFHAYLGALLLLLGDFEPGWREFEWMWRIPAVEQEYAGLRRPRWDGSPLAGRVCLLYGSPSFGDTLQWCRYAPELAVRGGRPLLVCQPELRRLLRTLPGVELVGWDDPLPPFDVHAPLMSLPYLLDMPVPPAAVPYLFAPNKADVVRWQAALPPGFKVGVVWAADPTHPGPWRTMPLRELAPLGSVSGVTCVSLQRGPAEQELLAVPRELRPIDLGPQLTDFADTAALLSQLDLVISVDTAMAHLAGALAGRAWVLLPALPDARWLLHRSSSPWYPTARLFRQPQPGDWAPVVEQVVEELRKLIPAQS